MSLYYTGVFVACEQEGCHESATFKNEGGHSPAVLEDKAILSGWYLPVLGGGKRLCPTHHMALAHKVGVESLYVGFKPQGVPIQKDEASKSAKKSVAAKEGAD